MPAIYDFEHIRQQKLHLPDLALENPAFQAMLARCRPFTLTSDERMYALHTAVQYILQANIAGDFVECGVWKGGSCMNIALTLLQQGARDRTIHLFDTYEGMTPPEHADVDLLGRSATQLLASPVECEPTKCFASLDEVENNMRTTGYPTEKIHFIKGPVETTLPARAPQQIALLRLDTDWYASTKHELEQLYPRLSVGGVLIIDYSGRLIVKR